MAALLWLHGLGDSGDGWRGAFNGLKTQVPGVKFFHPTAPEQPLSCDGGEETTSWFDIVTWRPPVKPIGLEEPDRPKGLEDSIKVVHDMFESIEKEGIPPERIVVGGFSQGGVISIMAALTYPKRLGGIVSISGWATHRDALAEMVAPANRDVPCLLANGTEDEVVDFALSKASGEALQAILGDNLSVMHTRRDMHQPDGSEMRAAMAFMARCLGGGQ
mmetsp:Transcript_45903/g.123337  ORF Transcript_45903/g.123337 Transcript_45903/m.123337 type:complete len:218 (-) Transcript_45903:49-702(-)